MICIDRGQLLTRFGVIRIGLEVREDAGRRDAGLFGGRTRVRDESLEADRLLVPGQDQGRTLFLIGQHFVAGEVSDPLRGGVRELRVWKSASNLLERVARCLSVAREVEMPVSGPV
jgi:hypothetical protein